MDKRKYKKPAFTLIELLVVIAIIGLLSTMSLVAFNAARSKARDAKRVADIHQIEIALELYRNEKRYYPENHSTSRCNVNIGVLSALTSEEIMSSIPIDPLNTSSPNPRYCYEYIGRGTSDYGWTSSWYCSGHSRTDYEWSIQFSTESDSFDFPRLTNSSGVPNNEYLYCITGPLIGT